MSSNPITSVSGADPKVVEERKANLPLPDQPPTASDWNSADSRTVNVGSGGQASGISHGSGADSLRNPATGASSVRADDSVEGISSASVEAGRTAKDGLSGLPNDAVTRNKKDSANLAQTTGEDYGYPSKSDPSSGLK